MKRLRRFLVAPDSFKGCLASAEVASAMGAPLSAGGFDVELLPMSDGGEGLLDALAAAIPIDIRTVCIHNPFGREKEARYGVMPDGTAVVESAEACGWNDAVRDPLRASSAGMAELVMAARFAGCRSFIIGLGGTCTSDAGAGMIDCFFRQWGGLPAGCRFTLAADVDAPLLGPRGATFMFARQKGASDEELPVLEERTRQFASMSAARMGHDMSGIPGAGAAGGLGYAFMQYLGATAVSGAELVMRLSGFGSNVSRADVVITGEGKSDSQTLMGKLPLVVLRRALQAGVAAWLVSGAVDDPAAMRLAGFAEVAAATPEGMPRTEALLPEVAKANISAAVAHLAVR